MKRWPLGLSILALALVAGCGAPAGSDGDLFDDWPAMAAAAVPVPKVGICYNGTGTAITLTAAGMTPVADCATVHVSETFFVGTFTGDVAAKTSPPENADLQPAYTECDKAAKEFLGDDWHNARLVLRIFTPSTKQWGAEARFFRCDLVEVSNDSARAATRTASLKDGLKGERPALLGCVTVQRGADNAIADFVWAGCTAAHDAEYAGTFFATDRPYPSDANARRALLQPACKTIVAQYMGMSEAQYDAHKQLSFGWSTASENSWERGDRTARCFIILLDKLTVTRSLKGAGPGPI